MSDELPRHFVMWGLSLTSSLFAPYSARMAAKEDVAEQERLRVAAEEKKRRLAGKQAR